MKLLVLSAVLTQVSIEDIDDSCPDPAPFEENRLLTKEA